LFSCASITSSTKDIKYMPVHFKPLARTDFSLVGNLEVQSTITGKIKGGKKVLDKLYSSNYHKGLITKTEATEIMYFAPKEGEAITGSLYENEIFNSVIYNPGGPSRMGFFASLKAKFANSQALMADPGIDFAYFAMVEKYPDIDYFVNVRFDRKLVSTGKSFTETIIVKADGVVLKTN